jgi:L-rhamnose mutarotase
VKRFTHVLRTYTSGTRRPALHNAGWRNYDTLHLREDGLLVGVLETEDLAAAQAAMDRTDVNQRWQAEMAPFFLDLDGTAPDHGMRVLPEIFSLEAQLERAEHPGGSR